jgi:tRNA(Ile)-lysidine synthase
MKFDKKIALSPFEKKFLEHCKSKSALVKSDAVLLALSGGADSVALFRLLVAVQPYLKLRVSVGHCNFQLRGSESNGDERFCARLCKKFNVPFFCARFETARQAQASGRSIQETARALRYDWFQSISAERGFTKIATAHQANDNAETMLFNLFRGASLLGLAGIPERRENIIRPMLHLERAEILNYLAEKKQRYRVDSSNFLDDYDRNFIRLHVIPKIEERFKRKFLPNLSRLSENIGEIQAFVDAHISKLTRKKGLSFSRQSFDVAALQTLAPFEQKEIFKRALRQVGLEPSSQMLARLAGLLKTQSGRKVILSNRVEAVWKKSSLVFVTSPEFSDS